MNDPVATEDLNGLKTELLGAVANVRSLDELEDVRVRTLGKKGRLTTLMKTLGGLDPEARKQTGQALNAVKRALQDAIETRGAAMETKALNERLMAERVDVTLPSRDAIQGLVHPISRTVEEVVAIFGEMGFGVAEGPDIENGWNNFSALNIPPEHPARQEHDTFYLPDNESESTPDKREVVLRTHTSPVQIRAMTGNPPPFRIVVPGRTYRRDYDATHSPMFHQVEGLVVDEKSTMADLKGVLINFCRAFFGVDDLPVRFRPSYFPFTEPSAEVDIGCKRAGGELKIGHGDDWLEILGSGMVNPRVLENCGIDGARYQGYAFGMGVERIAMLKYGIPDLRTFYESDLRWLRHYGFSALSRPGMAGGL